MNKDRLQKITKAIEMEIDAFSEVMDVSKFRTLQKKLERFLITDAITGVLNRWKIEEILWNEIKRAKDNNSSFSLLMIDIDKFKGINDKYGHNDGDRVLYTVAQGIEYAFEKKIGKSHRLGRWGGDEFIYISHSNDIKKLKEKIDKCHKLLAERYGQVTLSVGIGTYKKGDTINSLVARADRAMYVAKKNGGKRVEFIV